MREIDLEPGCGEPPLRVYDTSGPYTDPAASIDIMAGLPALRRPWIEARGDVESYDARQIRPEDNSQLGPDRSGGVPPFPNPTRAPLRARAGDRKRTSPNSSHQCATRLPSSAWNKKKKETNH